MILRFNVGKFFKYILEGRRWDNNNSGLLEVVRFVWKEGSRMLIFVLVCELWKNLGGLLFLVGKNGIVG